MNNKEMKIHGAVMIEKLRKAYIDNKMSTSYIEKISEELFGIKVSADTIYKTLNRNHIETRSVTERLSISVSQLDFNTSYISENMIVLMDSFLLAGGRIKFSSEFGLNNNGFLGSILLIQSIEKDWVEYAIKQFNKYGSCEIKSPRKEVTDRYPNISWESRTLTHPDIVKQAERWHDSLTLDKMVPKDISITPSSLLSWYLGCGSLTKLDNDNICIIRLITSDLQRNDIVDILIPKLNAMGLKCSYDNSDGNIRIANGSIGLFFDIIGHKSPLACFDYKFDVPDVFKLTKLDDIVVDMKEKYRARAYIRRGVIECSRRNGGKLCLFTKDQALALRNKLDNGRKHVKEA